MSPGSDPRRLNRDWWDERARLHGQDAYYDVDAFLRGGSSLIQRDLDEVATSVGDVEGLELLHLQCHFGLDTLSWARVGARATGVDFSSVAVARARELAAEARIEACFVQADVQHLPQELSARFDIVFASDGVFCWIEDIDSWMRSAFAALRRGGRLVAIDGHPLLRMTASVDSLQMDAPYQGGVATEHSSPGSYALPDATTRNDVAVQYSHGLGDIVTAAVTAGFRIEALTEWLDDPRGGTDPRLTPVGDSFRLRVAGQDLPCAFGLRAVKEAG